MIAARDILGPAEVRKLCKVSRQGFANWRAKPVEEGGFPRPIRKLEIGELWDRREVTAWLRARRGEMDDGRTKMSPRSRVMRGE